uniref:Uncharacterized protein n=1 Tax=Rhizophagus irregularis (strain DAOM 181602 / DAOM 197198 / MUCL 43194) TaxID=747089 RepID=U9SQ00_RHIID
MVISERKVYESGYIAINIECRFTYRDHQTTLEMIYDEFKTNPVSSACYKATFRKRTQFHVKSMFTFYLRGILPINTVMNKIMTILNCLTRTGRICLLLPNNH